MGVVFIFDFGYKEPVEVRSRLTIFLKILVGAFYKFEVADFLSVIIVRGF